MGAQWVEAAGTRFVVTAPAWAVWQSVMERAAVRGEVEPWEVAAECLGACVQDGAGGPVAPASLSDEDRDRLLVAVLDQLEQERRLLALEVREGPTATMISGAGLHLILRPWSFGLRSEALRAALYVRGGEVGIDLPTFDRAMVLACAVHGDGSPVTAAELTTWPVPLGEAVVEALDRLNSPEPDHDAVLAACLQTGCEHPDLQVLRLCQAFGLSPVEAQALDSRVAGRLLNAAKAVQEAAGSKTATDRPTAASGQEGVTRILVTD